MYNKQCSPLFFIPFFRVFLSFWQQRNNATALFVSLGSPATPTFFVVKSIQSFLVLTDYGVSRQVFFGDMEEALSAEMQL